MTAIRPIIIVCDYPDCKARFDRGYINLADARKEAAEEGWVNYNGVIDLCGPAEKVPDWAAHSKDVACGHAGGEHQPVITPRGRKDINLSCSCGNWKDDAPFLGRATASYRWARHVRPTTTAPYSREVPSA